jgi:hypothetical protein
MTDLRRSWFVPLAFLCLLAGFFTMSKSPVLGIAMVLASAAVMGMGYALNRIEEGKRHRPGPVQTPQRVPPMQRISGEFELRQPAPKPATLSNPLVAVLRERGFPVNAPVFFVGDRAVTVRHILDEMKIYLEKQGVSMQEATPMLPRLYDNIWEVTGELTKKYTEESVLKAAIAADAYLKIKFENTPKKPE